VELQEERDRRGDFPIDTWARNSANVIPTSRHCSIRGSTAGKLTFVPASPPCTAGELRLDSETGWLAASTLASLQGGLMLTQAHRDPTNTAELSTALWILGSLGNQTPTTHGI
jgi:hypothetical protein